MEGDSTTIRSYRNDLDNICADVMPSSWEGHARITIRESDDVPQSVEQSAIEKAGILAEKKGIKPERAATAIINKLVERKE